MKILLCPLSDGGYLYPALTAGRELRRRGHHVSVLARSSAGPVVAEAGLPCAVAEDFGGHRAFSATWWGKTGAAQYRAVLRAARAARADLLVTSVLCNGALLAAEALDIPVAVVGLSAHLWDYRSGGDGEPHLGRTRESRTRDSLDLHAATREEVGLAGRAPRWAHDPLLGDALLLRGDPALEHPGAELPERVAHVGPLSWEPAPRQGEWEAVEDHLERTGRGKPVVYVHLGRFFGGRTLWPRLNEAFTGGPFQAVVEQGRSTDPAPAPEADILLVRKPWMGPLVDAADLVLANGTSAPVLSALLRGRPLVLSPNGSEQPLLTGACVRAGVAVRDPKTPSVDLSALLESVSRDEGLRTRARALGDRLAAVDGAARAADIVERVAQASATPKENHEYAISRPR
ncbi:UDP:flavonoid glycosyltransferase YjiC (YdhE family) [Streptomyces sp. PvR006]|uniref:glycosyltransferase n=1 Tax=Streptomyces sp. PvR006 TaxID=2817860 RepID=UPI001AE17E39|nr:glycosyltransferase [Streptomyces sp. PvR006]MBP2580401.1 UDP:flavonoid glycosyltransferase YjiC (YdhE family) [Streptomyces sp. PvR006]